MSLRCVRARGDVLLPLVGNPAGASTLGLGLARRDVFLLFEGRQRAKVPWCFATFGTLEKEQTPARAVRAHSVAGFAPSVSIFLFLQLLG
jgi:hypothetical protein